MSTLRFDSNETYTTEVTIRECDTYSESVFLSFDRNIIIDKIVVSNRGCSEMYITPNQLELLGKFFLRQAEELRQEQAHRHLSNRIRNNPQQG